MKKEEEIREQALTAVAEKMLTAARTAPKGKGRDTLELVLCDRQDIEKISQKLLEMAASGRAPDYFRRDGENIRKASAMLLLGTRIQTLGLSPCGMCGFPGCGDKPAEVPCVLNTTDLGIALGSAVSVAADNRVDNRIMYTVGQAVQELGLMDKEIRVIYGIPVSAGSKSPFFDR